MHDYLSKDKSSDIHYFVLSIGTVRGKPMTASGRPRKSHISTLIQYTTLWSRSTFLLLLFVLEYSLSSKKATVGHKNFSFCEQTLYKGLIDASCDRLQTTRKNRGQNNFWRNYELKTNFRGSYFHRSTSFPHNFFFFKIILSKVCTSSKFNTFHAKPVSF